jgi:iron complex transport system ATP-binding protein
VLHDLGLASAFASRVIVLNDGIVVGDGPPAAALDPDTVTRVFGRGVQVIRDAERVLVVPEPFA